ncbi:MAG TPA: hypothetical protein VIJ12_08850 [Candidatus Baltobacteraceae bacterium]
MKSVLAFLALALVLTTLPAYAENTRYVYNRSHTCAWMTIDIANSITKWRNVASGYLKPGESRTFTVPSASELKVRAQPTLHADCSGGQITDIDIVEKNAARDLGNSETTLYVENTIFRLKWGKL